MTPRSSSFRPAARALPGRTPLFLLALAALAASSCGDAPAKDSASRAADAAAGTADTAPGPASRVPSGAGQNAAEIYDNGRMLGMRGDLQGAAEEYRRATQLDPSFAPAYFDLGKTLVHLSRGTSGMQRDLTVLDQGIAALRKAHELQPEEPEFAYWAGRALDLRPDGQDEALLLLGEAVALDPEHGLAHKRIGLIHHEKGDLESARTSLERAQELLPDDGGVPFRIGMVLEELDDLEGARAAYERSVDVDPSMVGPHARLASVLAELGDEEGAALAKENQERWNRFDTELKSRVKRANEATDDADALLAAGEGFFAVGRWEEALSWFQRALAQDTSLYWGHYYSGVCLRHLDDTYTAEQHLLEAGFLEPSAFEPQLELIRLYAGAEEEEKLAQHLEKLDGELGSGSPEHAVRVADVLLELGRSDDAAARYAAVLEYAPENAEAKAGHARATGKDES